MFQMQGHIGLPSVRRGRICAPALLPEKIPAEGFGPASSEEDTETAAYLIGHLVHQMYKMLEKILRSYI